MPHLIVQERPAKALAARLEGVLAVDEATNHVVVLSGDSLVEVAWPPECSLVSHDGSLAVVDSAGRTVAEVGRTVVLGGGHAGPERAKAVSPTGKARVFAVAGELGLPTRTERT
jgi:hypothetical protein